MELTERQERILKTVVEEYVGTGRPVGSTAVIERSAMSVSSATVRNELALLEDQGLVLQLHTSGGRIPTTFGYRYYIEYLLPPTPMSNEDQVTIRHQFHQAHTELDEWMKLAAAVLAHRVHNVALITPPRVESIGFRHVELIAAQPHTVLIIVVLIDGSVMQELMAVEEAVSQETLRGWADAMNEVFGGSQTVAQIESRIRLLPEHLRPYGTTVLRLLSRSHRPLPLYHQGLGEMLRRPEFSASAHPNLAEGERLRRVLDFLQQGLAMEDLLALMAMEAGVQVVIGGEAPLVQLEDYSMVVGRYGGEAEGGGVVGVLGPTRMEYGHAISLVRYMTELMTDLVFGR